MSERNPGEISQSTPGRIFERIWERIKLMKMPLKPPVTPLVLTENPPKLPLMPSDIPWNPLRSTATHLKLFETPWNATELLITPLEPAKNPPKLSEISPKTLEPPQTPCKAPEKKRLERYEWYNCGRHATQNCAWAGLVQWPKNKLAKIAKLESAWFINRQCWGQFVFEEFLY